MNKDILCHHCHKWGHMQRAYKSKSKPPPTNTIAQVWGEEEREEGEEQEPDDFTTWLSLFENLMLH